MSEQPAAGADLLALYDEALPQVYGYLLSRCRQKALAKDLTAETFLAAVDTVRRDQPVSVAWLIIARHKLVDHRAAGPGAQPRAGADWAGAALGGRRAGRGRRAGGAERPGLHHRLALTLRYLDGLPVPEVARLLDRTLHATEALLVRARAAFRRAYDRPGTEVD